MGVLHDKRCKMGQIIVMMYKIKDYKISAVKYYLKNKVGFVPF